MMMTVTPAAARQILAAARQSNLEGIPLRIAARRNPDDSIDYAMGFDDAQREGGDDTRFSCEGVEIVVAAPSLDLLRGATLDFVELDSGQFEFIFLNPNDPHFVPPREDEGDGGTAADPA